MNQQGREADDGRPQPDRARLQGKEDTGSRWAGVLGCGPLSLAVMCTGTAAECGYGGALSLLAPQPRARLIVDDSVLVRLERVDQAEYLVHRGLVERPRERTFKRWGRE